MSDAYLHIEVIDAAVKAKCDGLTVTNPRSPLTQSVPSWFRHPTPEKRMEFPFIAISLINIEPAYERMHSMNQIEVTYWPDTYDDYAAEQATPLAEHTVHTQEYVPFDLTYQVVTHTRLAQHNAQLVGKLLSTGRFPARFGTLYVPEDGTTRRLDTLSIQPADYIDTDGKRTFRTVLTVRTTAELAPVEALQRVLVSDVVVDIDPEL